MSLCRIAGLRIPIVPMIETFHFKKKKKRPLGEQRISCILHPQTHLQVDASALARPPAYTDTHTHMQIWGDYKWK